MNLDLRSSSDVAIKARRAADLHRYRYLQLVLRKRIFDGQYVQGGPLDSERQLAQEFGVARVTVRSALEALEFDGLIQRRHGRGTFVKSSPTVATTTGPEAFEALFDSIMEVGLKSKVQVRGLGQEPAAAHVAQALGVAPGDLVLRMDRVRSHAGEPFSYSVAWVPSELVGVITRRALASQPLLALLAREGLQAKHARETVDATQADLDTADALQVPVGSALLRVRRVILDAQRKPMEYFEGQFRPESYRYQISTSSDPRRTRVEVAIAR